MFEYAQIQMLPKLSIVRPSPLVILHEAGYLQKSGKKNIRHSLACIINLTVQFTQSKTEKTRMANKCLVTLATSKRRTNY